MIYLIKCFFELPHCLASYCCVLQNWSFLRHSPQQSEHMYTSCVWHMDLSLKAEGKQYLLSYIAVSDLSHLNSWLLVVHYLHLSYLNTDLLINLFLSCYLWYNILCFIVCTFSLSHLHSLLQSDSLHMSVYYSTVTVIVFSSSSLF